MRKQILTIALAVLPTLWLAGCQTAETRQSQMEKAAPVKTVAQLTAEKAIADAQTANKAAAAIRNEWRDTGKLIKSAEGALKAGDFAKAKKLAEAATFQAKMAVEQAKANQNAGNPDYLYQ